MTYATPELRAAARAESQARGQKRHKDSGKRAATRAEYEKTEEGKAARLRKKERQALRDATPERKAAQKSRNKSPAGKAAQKRYRDSKKGTAARKRAELARDRARHYKIAINARMENQEHLRRIKLQRGCMDCGYRQHSSALDFDHRPGEEKSFTLASCGSRSRALVDSEVAKCDVVCANCHRIRTEERRVRCPLVAYFRAAGF